MNRLEWKAYKTAHRIEVRRREAGGERGLVGAPAFSNSGIKWQLYTDLTDGLWFLEFYNSDDQMRLEAFLENLSINMARRCHLVGKYGEAKTWIRRTRLHRRNRFGLPQEVEKFTQFKARKPRRMVS